MKKKGNSPPAFAGYGHPKMNVRQIMADSESNANHGRKGGLAKAKRHAAKVAAWNAMNPDRTVAAPKRKANRTRSLNGDGVRAEEMEKLARIVQAVTRKHAEAK